MKLTRKQIKEGLEATPIDTLLLGSPKTLTAKQKAFAEGVAKGKSKAEAYRSAYDTNTTAQAQRVEAHRLSMNPHIALMIDSMKVSLEAQKYLLPAHLRALTIQKLTEKALDPDVNHAQQIKALELLGKITEVALFSERKEIITTDTSATAKDRLIASLAQAIRSSSNITSAKKAEADDLLAEITGGNLSNPEPQTVDQAPDDMTSQEAQEEAPSISEAPEADQAETLTTSTIWFPFVDNGNFGFITACAAAGVNEATTVLTIAIATNLLRISDHLSTCSNKYWLFEEFPAQSCDCKCNYDDNRT